jgi:hypothetical protein
MKISRFSCAKIKTFSEGNSAVCSIMNFQLLNFDAFAVDWKVENLSELSLQLLRLSVIEKKKFNPHSVCKSCSFATANKRRIGRVRTLSSRRVFSPMLRTGRPTFNK